LLVTAICTRALYLAVEDIDHIRTKTKSPQTKSLAKEKLMAA